MMNREYDTIAAPLTLRGEAAVSLIRISGEDAISSASELFRCRTPLDSAPSHHVLFGDIVDSQGHCLDRALATVFKAPSSYTGEDVVELSLHGSPLLTDIIMNRLQEKGVRMADPGEFTRRAFVNGKLTLLEAEAVADLISAKTPALLSKAAAVLKGELDKKLHGLTRRLTHILGRLNLSIDFDEEYIADTHWADIEKEIKDLLTDIEQEIADSQKAIREKNGLHLLILGPPNAGKSSLMNALLGHERVLVSETPGTTRDYVTEPFLLEGHYLTLIDTAGLRDAGAMEIERKGIEKARALSGKADLIIYMLTPDTPLIDVPSFVREAEVPLIFVVNKCDGINEEKVVPSPWIPLSVHTEKNMEELKTRLALEASRLTSGGGSGAVLLNRRQLDHLIRARSLLKQAVEAAREGAFEEIVSDFIRSGAEELEMITGNRVVEEMLNHIFSRFCIGK
ncbi:MAG TPA: tRNA uridine-5-carboxymethylaminomethyl(34) synthesis GTPase MnmE [Firmicutes bacterium]|nr:tRNA uridine-5-carboxymethylaminomethyl(34) synthesis GTPase MnmE [Bacillota bacterium]